MESAAWLVVDGILLLLILWKLLVGLRRGAFHALGGAAALIGGILGGRWLQSRFAPAASERWIEPFIRGLLNAAKNRLGLEDLLENLSAILEQAQLPAFLKVDVLEWAAQRIQETGLSAVVSASDVIALRLAQWLLFLVGAALSYALIALVFHGIIDPVIRRLPLIRGMNRLLGAALGLLLGGALAGLLFCLAYHLLPPAFPALGKYFAPETVEASYLMRFFVETFPRAFGL